MEIDDESLRLVLEERRVERQVLVVVLERPGVPQIALVLREDRGAARGQAEGRFELGPVREERRGCLEAGRKTKRRGRVSARTPEDARTTGHDASDGVVDAIRDGARVHQDAVGDGCEPRTRVVVVDRGGRVGDVAAGHHHRTVHAAKQQDVERRRREHEPEGAVARRDRVRQRFSAIGAQQHDRRLGAEEEALFFR